MWLRVQIASVPRSGPSTETPIEPLLPFTSQRGPGIRTSCSTRSLGSVLGNWTRTLIGPRGRQVPDHSNLKPGPPSLAAIGIVTTRAPSLAGVLAPWVCGRAIGFPPTYTNTFGRPPRSWQLCSPREERVTAPNWEPSAPWNEPCNRSIVRSHGLVSGVSVLDGCACSAPQPIGATERAATRDAHRTRQTIRRSMALRPGRGC